MKKILLLFVAMICAAAGWAQSSSTVSATINGEKLTVALDNATEKFIAFQMDVVLPEGVEINSPAGAIKLAEDRLTQPNTPSEIDANYDVNFIVAYNQIGNVLRILGYNLENREIAGNAGELFTATLSAATDEEIAIENILFVKSSDLAETELQRAVVEKAGGVYCDFNGDGYVTGADVTLIVNVYLGKAPYSDIYDVLNSDHAVTGADVTATVAEYLANKSAE